MIPDIYIAATITSILSFVFIGGILFVRAPREQRPFLGLLLLMMLPMNPLTFYLVRMPIDGFLSTVLGTQNDLYQFIRTLYAPLTEEPAKLWPLLIPLIYHRAKTIPLHRAAFAIGLGFGIGEAWTVASILSKSPEIAKYPWYMLSGYMSERMMVCVMHSAFTASALILGLKHKRFLLGIFACMFLHFVGNFPLFLAGKNVFALGPKAWQAAVSIWVLVYFLVMGSFLAYLAFGKRWFKSLIRGEATCPECTQRYKHPIFGVNLIHKRYERCPHCKHWHMVSAFDETQDEANKILEDTGTSAPDPQD